MSTKVAGKGMKVSKALRTIEGKASTLVQGMAKTVHIVAAKNKVQALAVGSALTVDMT